MFSTPTGSGRPPPRPRRVQPLEDRQLYSVTLASTADPVATEPVVQQPAVTVDGTPESFLSGIGKAIKGIGGMLVTAAT